MSTGKNNFEINTEAQAERERRRQQPIRVGTRRRYVALGEICQCESVSSTAGTYEMCT